MRWQSGYQFCVHNFIDPPNSVPNRITILGLTSGISYSLLLGQKPEENAGNYQSE